MIKRRSDPWYKAADQTYPIRVKFVVPQGGMQAMGLGNPLHEWLQANLGPRMWSWGPAHSQYCGQATAYYFRRMEDAQRFLAAFPKLQLADRVEAPIDTTPAERVPYPGHSIGGGWKGPRSD